MKQNRPLLSHAAGHLRRPLVAVSRLVTGLTILLLICASCGTPVPPRTPVARPSGHPEPQHFDSLAVRFLRAMGDGKRVEVGKIERPLGDYRDQPVSLLIRSSSPATGEPSGTKIRFEQRFEIGRERSALPSADLDCSAPATCAEKEWIELELKGGGASRVLERVLRVRSTDGDDTPGYRRYTIVALQDAIARDDVRGRIGKIIPELKIDARKAQIEALRAEAQGAKRDKAPALVAKMDDLDAGASLAHLMALGFAAESDEATAALARRCGVTPQRLTPRISIVGVEARGDEDPVSFSLDLRLDEVETVPSDPPQAARTFQHARGIQESMLEGAWLGRLAGEGRGVSTAALMRSALEGSVPLVVVPPDNRTELPTLELPQSIAPWVNAALDRGHHVVLPRSAVDLAGRSRWGFWDIDSVTGRTIGVMEGGQQQGMVEVPVINTEVPLNPAMGFLLGLHAGAVAGQFALAGLMLKYGAVTPELIQELKEILKDVACKACPDVNVGMSVSIKVGECLKKDIVSISKGAIDFCASYQDGFKCAVGILVASLEETNPAEVKVEGSGPTLTIACKEISAG